MTRTAERYEIYASNIVENIMRKFTGKALKIIAEDENDCFNIRYSISSDDKEVISIRIQKESTNNHVNGLPGEGVELKRGSEVPDTEMSEKERARFRGWCLQYTPVTPKYKIGEAI